jgi:hypothetical protein
MVAQEEAEDIQEVLGLLEMLLVVPQAEEDLIIVELAKPIQQAQIQDTGMLR